jgi:hypothetical protein
MADCTTVFETLTGFLPMNILEKAVDQTNSEHGTKKFTVLRQLNCRTPNYFYPALNKTSK